MPVSAPGAPAKTPEGSAASETSVAELDAALPPEAFLTSILESAAIEVVGNDSGPRKDTPGTSTIVGREQVRQLAPQSAADVLRVVPGLNVISEDGAGLRLNVGIRGLDPSRSRKLLVLEDGVPVTLNPYGTPELHYAPAIERMERLEVVKGSERILWGPQTLGAMLNFVTRAPPKERSGSMDVRYGNFGYLLAQGGVGATHDNIGWRVDVVEGRGPRGRASERL